MFHILLTSVVAVGTLLGYLPLTSNLKNSKKKPIKDTIIDICILTKGNIQYSLGLCTSTLVNVIEIHSVLCYSFLWAVLGREISKTVAT